MIEEREVRRDRTNQMRLRRRHTDVLGHFVLSLPSCFLQLSGVKAGSKHSFLGLLKTYFNPEQADSALS